MLREERALTAIEIIKEMRLASERAGSPELAGPPGLTEATRLARDAQLRQDMEVVRWVGGLRPGRDEQ
jgi:hypothetical protein